jgi:hypothetical protein
MWNGRPGGLQKQHTYWYGMCLNHIQLRTPRNNTNMRVIPGGLTSLVLPLDACLNKLLRDNVHILWNEWMLISKSHSRKVEIFTVLSGMYHVSLSSKHGMM